MKHVYYCNLCGRVLAKDAEEWCSHKGQCVKEHTPHKAALGK